MVNIILSKFRQKPGHGLLPAVGDAGEVAAPVPFQAHMLLPQSPGKQLTGQAGVVPHRGHAGIPRPLLGLAQGEIHRPGPGRVRLRVRRPVVEPQRTGQSRRSPKGRREVIAES